MGAVRGHRSAAGFTLVELLVATLISVLALGIAARLMMASQRMFALAGREQLDPVAAYALGQLRADAQSASGVTGAPAPGLPTSGPLVLLGLPAGTVVYVVQDGDLARLIYDGGGHPGPRRTLLRGVSSWLWRETVPGRLLTIELSFRRHATPMVRAEAGPRPVPGGATVETPATISIALRGGVRVQRW